MKKADEHDNITFRPDRMSSEKRQIIELEGEIARLKREMKDLAQMIEDGFPNAAMKELRRLAGE